MSVGAGGIIHTEISRCLSGSRDTKPLLIDYILGLGGRDVTFEDMKAIGLDLFAKRDSKRIPDPIRWHQVRGLS